MKPLYIIIIITLVFSCNSNVSVEEEGGVAESSLEFCFEDFEIKKGKLGNIEIGMSINEVDNVLKKYCLNKQEHDAFYFGYGGGGMAYSFSYNEEYLFTLITNKESKQISTIIVYNKNFQTKNGLSVESSIQDLINIYGDIIINRNMINENEYFFDRENQWEFVFETKQENLVGKYKDIDTPIGIKNMNAKVDYINIL